MIYDNRWIHFENLVGQVLQELGYSIELSSQRSRHLPLRQIDIIAREADGAVRPVEVKLTNRTKVSLALLRDASAQTADLRPYANSTVPLLVFGAIVDHAHRLWAEREFNIEVWDRDILLSKTKNSFLDLQMFFDEHNRSTIEQEERGARAKETPSPAQVSTIDLSLDPPPLPQGDMLINKLQSIDAGKAHAKRYEEACRDIIAYLFGDDLRDGRSQKRTSDGLNVYDLVYRVNPRHPFWITLTRDFRARVVLFECKNYGKPIRPEQVFTTERYLSLNAMRAVCFVLSRKPVHKHAVHAAYGAMRDSGKLLVFLSDVDLIEMIRAKDAQVRNGGTDDERLENDPTEVLDQRIYEFIAGMPR